ncbi:metal-sensitive transcriptional regulator [Thermohalobacter berrensis]|uniref:Transcriptional regulator n=1 Tax=Thermohalobacter berrensis TaxID=99594 RepID=A0A419TB13_9FIRM|nr:metal-sensitive transcriptional regulator [Thermohalobacter berrensis]RKD34637.1 hypothetical protein BET03_02080 [Thermohalobacter berrensis]
MEKIVGTSGIIKRLRRIEGQIKGIQRMVEEEKCCKDILIQIAAARAALNKVGGLLLENHVKDCFLKEINDNNKEELINELIDIMMKYTK